MKPLLASLAIALLGICAGACGSTTRSTSSAAKTSSELAAGATTPTQATTTATTGAIAIPKAKAPLEAPQRRGIHDTYDEDDTAPRKTEEKDDEEIEIYGKQASPTEWLAAVAFAKAYFAAAAAENGAAACALLVPSLAQGMGGSYESPSDPVYLHGKTCPEVMTKLFVHRHKLMAAEAKGLEVTDVRVTSRTAFILLAFKGIRERRYMGVERFPNNIWKLEALIDSQYP
jgi:hypothetical protein